jgi:monofunctional glycosyltransferase
LIIFLPDVHLEQESLSADLFFQDFNFYLYKGPIVRRLPAKILRIIRQWLLAVLAVSIALVLCLRWVAPPTSAFMIEARMARLMDRNKKSPVRYHWIDMRSISPYLPLAVIAAEDQKFPFHWGFDVGSIKKAMESYDRGHRLRGASTITQQVAKNLFLWPGRSFIRKGLEAYFTVLLETFWPKRRILEVYLNIAQFGDGVFGAKEASVLLLKKSPLQLTRDDAALLAAVLPDPTEYKVTRPSHYVNTRRQWIKEQAVRLGGTAYLKDI